MSVQELDSKLLLGRYRALQLLAEGGMGKVYLARLEGAEGFTRPVVVKVMRSDMREADDANRLFRREAEILSKMQHPGIANIIDFGSENGANIMVLEYAHGYSASKWLDYRHARGIFVAVDVCLYIVRRVLEALDYAHHFDIGDGSNVEIIHRDVAADNVLLDRNGYIYLLDFGIASIGGNERRVSTGSDTFRGKLGYAAPETLNGYAASPRSDQYSAAVLLLELLTLETPFQADSVGETVHRMMHDPPPLASALRADIKPELDAVLARALSKQPSERFDSVRTLSRELRKLQREDDEEVAVELKRLLDTDFEQLPAELGVESLQVRETALAQVLPSQPAHDVAVPLDRRLRNLLVGLVAVGALTALALGVVAALLSREDDRVVVVGGDKSTEPAKATPPTPASLTAPGPAAGTPASPQEALSRAVQGQGAAFESCFVTHLDLAEKMPEANLHFAVAVQGGSASVEVQPASLGRSALGLCLKAAAEQVHFPKLERPMSFRVPVRARFARLK